MPLLVICGNLCSGKTTRAQEIMEYLTKEHKADAMLINQESLGLQKNQAYSTFAAEKQTRGKLKAQVARSLSREKVVICDSLNYIKGFRYQLYCLAREVKSTNCMFYLRSQKQHCLSLNAGRKADAYDNALLADLVGRMQHPSLKNRWDTPLFERRVDESTPLLQIAQALLYQVKTSKDPIATKPLAKLQVDHMQAVDKAVQDLLQRIVQQQADFGPQLVLTSGKSKVALKTRWSVAALRNLKKQFIKIAVGSKLSPEDGCSLFLTMLVQRENR